MWNSRILPKGSLAQGHLPGLLLPSPSPHFTEAFNSKHLSHLSIVCFQFPKHTFYLSWKKITTSTNFYKINLWTSLSLSVSIHIICKEKCRNPLKTKHVPAQANSEGKPLPKRVILNQRSHLCGSEIMEVSGVLSISKKLGGLGRTVLARSEGWHCAAECGLCKEAQDRSGAGSLPASDF